MDSPSPFKSKTFLHSVYYAMEGIRSVLDTERNFRTHLLLALLVLLVGLILQVDRLEWVLLVLCMVLMMVVETLNTAIEVITDMLSGGEYNTQAKLAKDISAGACLITAIGVTIAGALIFGPRLLALLQ